MIVCCKRPIIKTLCLCYLPQPSASADNTDLGFDNSLYHAQPHPVIPPANSILNENPAYYQVLNALAPLGNMTSFNSVVIKKEKKWFECPHSN